MAKAKKSFVWVASCVKANPVVEGETRNIAKFSFSLYGCTDVRIRKIPFLSIVAWIRTDGFSVRNYSEGQFLDAGADVIELSEYVKMNVFEPGDVIQFEERLGSVKAEENEYGEVVEVQRTHRWFVSFDEGNPLVKDDCYSINEISVEDSDSTLIEKLED